MKPRPLVVAAGEGLVGAGGAGWAWRSRPRARLPGVSPKCSHSAAAAEGVVQSEHHRRRRGGVRGVLFRPAGLPRTKNDWKLEERIEKVIYACRFMTFLGIGGLLAGSIPCFLKGWVYVMDAFVEYYLHGGGTVVRMLLEAIDLFLIGTVMFVFGTGLYELFISNMDMSYGSNLFGLFNLPERPKWLVINSVNDLKTKLGHVIVMSLLVGIFEKSMRLMLQFSNILTKCSLISTIYMCQMLTFELSAPTHARKLEVRAPIINVRPSCTGRSVLQAPSTQTDSTTPGHSPSIGHNSPPN
ncbi:hypothetical protein PVAP13_4KG381502 [Panicum virgatum]|uniref:Uncharacterized protein n=1 Tax=Panicum virgatum TaxID=38727 RepID=A0A8T0TZ13_PANVG|nr:hypothetical protein PVAP13_4KG381502 [Panicum virgatum]